MGNRGITRTSGKSLSDVVPATNSTDDQGNVNVEVTVLADKIGTTEDGTILFKQLSIRNYIELPLSNDDVLEFFMFYHNAPDKKPIQLGISPQRLRPFGGAILGHELITFTGTDDNYTMTNPNGENSQTLYLRGRREGRTVLSHDVLNDNSYFSIWVRPHATGPNNGALCMIFVVNRPSLAFWYDNTDNVVKTREFENSDPAFEFELLSHNLPAVEFIYKHTRMQLM